MAYFLKPESGWYPTDPQSRRSIDGVAAWRGTAGFTGRVTVGRLRAAALRVFVFMVVGMVTASTSAYSGGPVRSTMIGMVPLAAAFHSTLRVISFRPLAGNAPLMGSS